LLLLLAVVIFAGASLGQIRFDSSVERLIDKNSADWQILQKTSAAFGSDDVIVVAQLGTGPALEAGRLARLAALGERIEAIAGVERVWSLTASGNVHGEDGALEIRDLSEELPQDAAALADLAEEIRTSPLYRNHLLSPDGRTPILLIFPQYPLTDADGMVDELREVLATAGGPERLIMTGNPPFTTAVGRTMQSEQGRFTSITLALLVLILALAFRQIRAIALPLLGASAAVVMVLGAMTWLGGSISTLSTILPSLILALGIAYSMHFLVRISQDGSRAGTTRALRHILLPTLLSVVTTMIGFAALATSQIDAIREFGILAAIATAAVGVTALLVPAAGAAWLGPRRPQKAPPGGALLTSALTGCRRAASQHSGAILIVALVVALGTLAGISRLYVDTSFIDYLEADHPANIERLEVLEHVAGPIPLRITLDAGQAGGILQPQVLGRMQAFQDWAKSQPGIDASFSITNLLGEMHYAWQAADGEDATRALPSSAGMAAQFLLLYESSDFADDLEKLLSADRSEAVIWVRTAIYSSAEARDAAAAIRSWLATNMSDLNPQLSGTLFSLLQSSDEVAAGQARSLGIALVAIAFVLMAVLRSVRLGLLAAAPNLLPILMVFGVMGWAGIPLNLGTAVVACLSLGVATDDTIHFIVAWRHERARALGGEEALARTFATVGRGIALTSVALLAAFTTLSFSSFAAVRDLGWLTALTMVSCLLADLLLLPALLVRFGPRPTAHQAPVAKRATAASA
ncbi:MAG: MMPL family transporter, partial [Deltaproteobacteria bacterium]